HRRQEGRDFARPDGRGRFPGDGDRLHRAPLRHRQTNSGGIITPSCPGRGAARRDAPPIRDHPTSALAAILTVSAISAALNRNDTTPCAATVRRMVRPVTATSDTCEVIPITSEK